MEMLYFILALIFGAGLGIGSAFFICASMLKSSNDIGDSVDNGFVSELEFTVKEDRLKANERETFIKDHVIPLKPLYDEPSDAAEVHKLSKD